MLQGFFVFTIRQFNRTIKGQPVKVAHEKQSLIGPVLCYHGGFNIKKRPLEVQEIALCS